MLPGVRLYFAIVDAVVVALGIPSVVTGNVFHSHFNQIIDDSLEIVCFTINLELPVRGSATLQNRMHVFDLFSRSQLINYIVNKFE